jgi:hypothetical protein
VEEIKNQHFDVIYGGVLYFKSVKTVLLHGAMR